MSSSLCRFSSLSLSSCFPLSLNRILSPMTSSSLSPSFSSSSSSSPSLSLASLNPKVLSAQYAVRGELVIKADAIRQKISTDPSAFPFKKVISCNIGNPQELGQNPLSFHRMVMSLLQSPSLMDIPSLQKEIPSDAIQRAKGYLKEFSGMGAYTHSQGIKSVRQEVAKFIENRDNFPANSEDIYLTDGASSGVKLMSNLILSSQSDGLMIPIPQYPLYTATIALMGGSRIDYLLHEDKGWALKVEELEKAAMDAKAKGVNPRGLVIINPGNPTGQCLERGLMKDIVKFAEKHNILLMADEVYQANVYSEGMKFHSFKSVVRELNSKVQLVSFHSTSKGFIGECGQRGGYMELVNIPEDVKQQILKMSSISLCSNTSGQIMTGLMVNPPKEGDVSYGKYSAERDGILASLQRRARKVADTFNSLPLMKCNAVDGALYAFPSIFLPSAYVAHAKSLGKVPDVLFCLELLESTGICVVPGSGFGQKEGTWHFRTTILPAEKEFDEVMGRFAEFQKKFAQKWGDKKAKM